MISRELTGDFIIYLYDNGYIRDNWVAAKRFVLRKFQDFLQQTDRTVVANNDETLDQSLTQFNFVCKGIKDETIFKFDSQALFKYRKEIIARRDKMEIENAKSKAFNSVDSNTISLIQDVPNVLPDLSVYALTYEFGFRQNINPSFLKAENGCYCCQINFQHDNEILKHIEYHSEDSGFKSQHQNNENKLQPHLELFYRPCENSLLQFSLNSIQKRQDVIIEKILLFLIGSVSYLEDAAVPYLLPSDGTSFYINSNIFEIGHEYPIIVIFKMKNDPKGTRCIEEHHFLRFENFPVLASLKANHVFRRSTLEVLDKLDTYQPTPMAKAMCSSGFDEQFHTIKRSVRDYLKKVVTLNDTNICDIFCFLLEMDDFARTKIYEKFNQSGVKIEGHYDNNYSLKIKCPDDDQCSYENLIQIGDQIVLTRKNPKSNKNEMPGGVPVSKFPGTVIYITCDRVYFRSKSGKLAIDYEYDVIFEPHRFDVKYQHRALEILRNDIHLRARLFPENVVADMPVSLEFSFLNQNILMDSEQRLAVQNIVESRNRYVPFLIYGPSGTGKTTVIVEAILQLWKKSPTNKILVTAYSNGTCDEIAARLCHYLKRINPNGMHLLRIYADFGEKMSAYRNKDILELSNLCYGQHFYPSLSTIGSYSIVLTTLNVVGKLVHAKISPNHFTHVFIDDAGSTTEVNAIVGLAGILSTSGQLILAGDPKTLRPDVKCRYAAEYGLERSLLERLMDRSCYQTNSHNKSIQILLTKNFRTNKAIFALPNKLFYNNELQAVGPEEVTNMALGWSKLRNKNFPVILERVNGFMKKNGTSFYNYHELNSVMLYVKELKFFGVKGRAVTDEEIGIISPYEMQCHLIRRELARRGWLHIQVDTIEAFQNKEKPIIIVSMVQSLTTGSETLDNMNKLHILLTRPEALLIFIGNLYVLSKLNAWRHFIDYCRENGALISANDNDSPVSESMRNLSIQNNNPGNRKSNKKQSKNEAENNFKKANPENKKINKEKNKRSIKKELKKNRPKKEAGEKDADLLQWLDDLPNVMNIFETSSQPAPINFALNKARQGQRTANKPYEQSDHGSVSNLSDISSKYSKNSEGKSSSSKFNQNRGKLNRGGNSSTQRGNAVDNSQSSYQSRGAHSSRAKTQQFRGAYRANYRGKPQGDRHPPRELGINNDASENLIDLIDFNEDRTQLSTTRNTNPFVDNAGSDFVSSSLMNSTANSFLPSSNQSRQAMNPFFDSDVKFDAMESNPSMIMSPSNSSRNQNRTAQSVIHSREQYQRGGSTQRPRGTPSRPRAQYAPDIPSVTHSSEQHPRGGSIQKPRGTPSQSRGQYAPDIQSVAPSSEQDLREIQRPRGTPSQSRAQYAPDIQSVAPSSEQDLRGIQRPRGIILPSQSRAQYAPDIQSGAPSSEQDLRGIQRPRGTPSQLRTQYAMPIPNPNPPTHLKEKKPECVVC